MPCLFCNLDPKAVIDSNALAFAIYDKFPVSQLHTLVIPKRHVENYFDLTDEEVGAVHELLQRQQRRICESDSAVTGFNIGINIGADAGQSIFHVHVHLIPRRRRDMANPKGGVRGVIPEKQQY